MAVVAHWEFCASLCEQVPRWNGASAVEDALLGVRSACDWAPELPTRVYVGSSFCPNVFCAFAPARMRELSEWCATRGVPVTIVVPLASERWLRQLDAHVFALLEASGGVADELTVNDYGALVYWGAWCAEHGMRLNVGRLVNKDPRDPRDPDYPHLRLVPSVLQADWRGWTNFDRLMQTVPVDGIEFDPFCETIDLSALPSSVVPAVHGPLCYLSTGRICEYASVGLPVEEKFRPNVACSLQCQSAQVRYRGASGVQFAKLGRSVFYRAAQPQVTGVERCRYLCSAFGVTGPLAQGEGT